MKAEFRKGALFVLVFQVQLRGSVTGLHARVPKKQPLHSAEGAGLLVVTRLRAQ